jgi:RNA polymerase sigma factor (sigma-70 family)
MIRRYAVDGCQEAFSELVQRHSDTVYSVCLHVLGDRIAAEDATQAAFLVLARRARSVAGGKVVAGWLITTARNCALNMKKAAARRNRIERETLMHRSQPELSVINDEMRKVIHEAIASLPAQQRNVVILRYLQNRTQAETAVELNCAEHSVSAALSKALARLQQ